MATFSERLAIIIDAKTGGAVTAINAVGTSAERTAVKQAALKVATDANQVALARQSVVAAKTAGDHDALTAATARLKTSQTALAGSRADLGVAKTAAALTQAERAAAGAEGGVGRLRSAFQSLTSSSAAVTAGLGVAAFAAAGAVVKLGKDSVSAFTDLADSIRLVQQNAGGTTEDASRLVAIFDGMGVSVDTAALALFRLNKNVAENQAKLESLGVVVAKNQSGTTDAAGTLVNLTRAYQGTADSATRAEIVQKAFGRGGAALLPILNASAEQLQAFQDAAARRGQIFTSKDEQNALNFEIQLRQLGKDLKAIEVEIGRGIVPTLGDMAAGIDSIIQKAHNIPKPVGDFLSGLIKGLGGGTTAVVEGLAHIGHNANQASVGLDQFAASAQIAAQAQEDAKKALSDEAGTVDGLVGALRTYNSATDKVAASDRAIADAHDEVATKARDEADATDQAAKANYDLSQAQDSLSKAQRDAPQNLARARSDAAKATDAEALAVDDLRIALVKYGVGTKQAQAAQDALTSAKLDTVDASQKVSDLEAAGNRPPDVVAAEERVASARKEQATAAEAKTKADREDPVADLAKAERDKADAVTEQVTDYRNLNIKLGEFNTGLGTSVTLADLMSGAVNQMLRDLIQAEATQQDIINNSAAAAAAAEATNAANRAAVVLDHSANPDAGAAPAPSGGSGSPLPGDFVARSPFTSGFGAGPGSGVVNNYIINVQSIATAGEIADEVAFSARGHYS